MPSNHLILFCPLLPPSVFPSIRAFYKESAFRIRWPSIGVSASASVLPTNIQDWSPLGLTGLISLQSRGLSRVFSNTTVQSFSICISHLLYPFIYWWVASISWLLWIMLQWTRRHICCCRSVAKSCPTLCDPMDCSMPGFPVLQQLQSLFKLMSIESVMPSIHLVLSHPPLLLPSVFPSSLF